MRYKLAFSLYELMSLMKNIQMMLIVLAFGEFVEQINKNVCKWKYCNYTAWLTTSVLKP